MKILCLTDIHGEYRTAEEIIACESPEIVIIGGDLTTAGTVKEAEDAIKRFQRLSSNLLCIAGNMDAQPHDYLHTKLSVSLNANGVIINNVGFFGVSSAPFSPLHTLYEISEDEIAKRIKEGYNHIRQAEKKILVSHAPPYGTKVDTTHSGIHAGSTAVRKFIVENQPDVVICGHIHEARGQDRIEKSIIVNCGPTKQGYYATIEISAEKTEVKNLNLLKV